MPKGIYDRNKRTADGDSGNSSGSIDLGGGIYTDADGNLTRTATDTGDSTDAPAGNDTGTSGGSSASIFIDPATATGSPADSSDTDTVRKKRGRPKGSGSGSKTSPKKVQTSLEGIEGILLSIHAMGAAALKIPELNLEEEEAEKLTAAINRVAVLYDFGASEKTLAWVNLAICCGGMYGTRAIAYNLRVKNESKKVEDKKAAPVITFPSFT